MTAKIAEPKAGSSPLANIVSGVTRTLGAPLRHMVGSDHGQGGSVAQGAWKVEAVDVSRDNVKFTVRDQVGAPFDINLPRAEVKLVQYVGKQNDPEKELYVQINKAPLETYIGGANTVLYIGEAKWQDFDAIGRKLERNGIEWIWNTDHSKDTRPDRRPTLKFKLEP